jgi:hypothetical protein
VLAEQHDEWAVARRYMSADSLSRARHRAINDQAADVTKEVITPELPTAV